MIKILLFTNILTPYRSYFYDLMYEYCHSTNVDFRVWVMTRTEENRNWNYEDFSRVYTTLLEGKRIKLGSYRVNINKNLKQRINEYNPDFIIAAGSYIHPSLWNLISIANDKKIPIFFWSESHLNTIRDYSSFKLAIREYVRNIIYKKFDGFFYSGLLSKNFIEKYSKVSATKIFLPNLVDDEYYSNKVVNSSMRQSLLEKYGIQGYDKIYICPARLSNDKGLIPFLELLKKIDTKENYIFCIAGDGELYEPIKCMIEKYNLRVKLLGFRKQNEIRELYQISDGFILPSIVDPNPLTCIEALWSGLPLLISDHVGNGPEVVDQGRNGYVFEYNTSACIDIIKCFIESSKDWKNTAENTSLNKADKLYNSKKQVVRIIAEIMEYIETK